MRPYSIDAAALGAKISGSKRLLLYRGISLESRRLLPDILSPSASINGCSVYRVRSLFPVNLPYGISMFLLVISVKHTNTIWKVSSWILLTGKSLQNSYAFSVINTILSSLLNGNSIAIKNVSMNLMGNSGVLAPD